MPNRSSEIRDNVWPQQRVNRNHFILANPGGESSPWENAGESKESGAGSEESGENMIDRMMVRFAKAPAKMTGMLWNPRIFVEGVKFCRRRQVF
jgi:hypothetical protein